MHKRQVQRLKELERKKVATTEISLEHSNGKPTHDESFQQEPGPASIKESDERSKNLRSELQEDSAENTLWIAETTPTHSGIIKDKVMKTLIREIDTQRHEEEHAKSKIPECWEWIDNEAKNT